MLGGSTCWEMPTHTVLSTPGVLMGSFHGHGQGREDDPRVVSKSLSGTGKGSIETDVVRGRVELKAGD